MTDYWSNRIYGTNTPTSNNDDLNIPVTSQHGASSLSPYLNFDPSYLPTNQPEFLYIDGASRMRGRFEYALGHIGGAAMTGATMGGTLGLYRGIKATTLANQTGKLRRTQLINHAMKNGASVSTTLGTITLVYSGIGVLLEYLRGTEDSLNTLASATATGMFFKATGGLKSSMRGGVAGLALASIWCFWNNREALSELGQPRMNPA